MNKNTKMLIRTVLHVSLCMLLAQHITDRRDGLYTAELQIGGQLQYHVFKLKVYRPVSKPNVTCSVTDSNVTVLCEGDESLGDQYRWEVLENQVHRGTTNGKNLTFSKEENHNIEYTCIFSNLKSEERSDPIKNCFVPGGRSHIWVPILVLLAVLAGLIVWVYKFIKCMKVRGTHGNSMAGHNGTCMDCFIRKQQGEQINETVPFIKTNQRNSENKPAPEGEAPLSPAPQGEAPLSPAPQGEAPLSSAPVGKATLSSAPEREVLLSPAPQREAPLSPVPQREDLMSSVPEGEALLSPAPQGEDPLSPLPEGEASLSSAPEGEAPLSPAAWGEATLSPAPQGEAPLSPVPQREDLLSSVPEGEALLSPAPQGEAPLSPAPRGKAPLSPAPQGEAQLSPALQDENKDDVTRL